MAADPLLLEKVAQSFAAHPDWTQVQHAKDLCISTNTVSRYRAILLGKRTNTNLTPLTPEEIDSRVADQQTEEEAYAAALEAVADPAKLMELAARYLADVRTPIAARVRIMEFLAARHRETAATTALPPPTSDADQMRRAAQVVRAVGRERLDDLIATAFPPEAE